MLKTSVGEAHARVLISAQTEVEKTINDVFPQYDPKDGCYLLSPYDSKFLSKQKLGIDPPPNQPLKQRTVAVIFDPPFKPQCGSCCCCDDHTDEESDTGKKPKTKAKSKKASNS